MKNQSEALAKDIAAEQAGLPLPTDQNLDTNLILKKAEALIKAMDGMIKLSLLKTNSGDWTRFGEGYWLNESGAMKVRNVWGIYIRNTEIAEQKNEDGSVTYISTAQCGASWLDKWYGQECLIDAYGSRSTGDEFFGENPDKEDVKKAALANMRARGICDVLGLKNMTAEDLKKNGIDVSRIQSVTFRKGSRGGATATEDEKETQTKLYNLVIQLTGTNDEKVMGDYLEKLTSFVGKDGKTVPGVRSFKYLTGRRLEVVYGKAKDILEKEGATVQVGPPVREPGEEG